MDMRLPVIPRLWRNSRRVLKKHPVYRNMPILAAAGSAGDLPTAAVSLRTSCDEFRFRNALAISVLERASYQPLSADFSKTIVASKGLERT